MWFNIHIISWDNLVSSTNLIIFKQMKIIAVYTQLKQLRNKAWKKFRPERESNPWPLRYRCSALTNWAIKPTGSWELIHRKDFFKLFLILYDIKQIDSNLPCVCSVIDHRGCQNVIRISGTHSVAPRVPLFSSYHILTSSVIYYWTDTQQLGIYLLIWTLVY